eukprot:4173584-Amphidinium_carterae.1
MAFSGAGIDSEIREFADDPSSVFEQRLVEMAWGRALAASSKRRRDRISVVQSWAVAPCQTSTLIAWRTRCFRCNSHKYTSATMQLLHALHSLLMQPELKVARAGLFLAKYPAANLGEVCSTGRQLLQQQQAACYMLTACACPYQAYGYDTQRSSFEPATYTTFEVVSIIAHCKTP